MSENIGKSIKTPKNQKNSQMVKKSENLEKSQFGLSPFPFLSFEHFKCSTSQRSIFSSKTFFFYLIICFVLIKAGVKSISSIVILHWLGKVILS